MLLCTTLCFYSNVEAKDGRYIKWEHWCELHTVPVYPLHILNETKILTELAQNMSDDKTGQSWTHGPNLVHQTTYEKITKMFAVLIFVRFSCSIKMHHL